MAQTQDEGIQAQMSDILTIDTYHNVSPPPDLIPRISDEVRDFLTAQGEVSFSLRIIYKHNHNTQNDSLQI